ncbi:MAG: hypothetical protein NTW05_28440 [Pseudonocardiales bacterium]|nr:hypothetical protein [Pseudonocardiales bacterium]
MTAPAVPRPLAAAVLDAPMATLPLVPDGSAPATGGQVLRPAVTGRADLVELDVAHPAAPAFLGAAEPAVPRPLTTVDAAGVVHRHDLGAARALDPAAVTALRATTTAPLLVVLPGADGTWWVAEAAPVP